MANRNECFSDFSRQRTAKERWVSFPNGWPWRISGDAPPPPPESVRTFARSLARSHADVITKFSRLDGLPICLTHGASLGRFARWSSAKIQQEAWMFFCQPTFEEVSQLGFRKSSFPGLSSCFEDFIRVSIFLYIITKGEEKNINETKGIKAKGASTN